MRCNRCSKGSLIEIRMTVAGADLTFRRCGRCENQVWEGADGPLPADDGPGARPLDVAGRVARSSGRLTPAPYRRPGILLWVWRTRHAGARRARRADRDRAPATRSDRPPPRGQWWDRVDGWIGLLVVLACVVFVADPAQPEVPVPQHDGHRRRHRRARLVAGVPPRPPVAVADRGLVARLVRRVPGRAVLLPGSRAAHRGDERRDAVQHRVQDRHRARVAAPAHRRVRARPSVCARRVPRPRRWPSPRPRSCSGPATPGSPRRASRSRSTSTSWAGRSPARWPVSSRSRSRSRSRCSSSGRSPMRSHTRRRLWLPALLLALTVTSHLMVGVFAVVAGLIVWLFHHPWRNFGRTVAIGVVGALLTAVWALPLLATYAFTTDMRYSPIGECASGTTCNLDGQHYVDYLFPSNLFDPHGLAARTAGARTSSSGSSSSSRSRWRGARRWSCSTITLASGLMFRFWTSFGTKVWNLRALPFWYISIFLLMGVAVAELVIGCAWLACEIAARRDRSRTDVASGVASDVPPDARWDVPVATYARTDTATIPLSDDLVFDEEAYLDLAYPDSPRADPPVADPPVADAPGWRRAGWRRAGWRRARSGAGTAVRPGRNATHGPAGDGARQPVATPRHRPRRDQRGAHDPARRRRAGAGQPRQGLPALLDQVGLQRLPERDQRGPLRRHREVRAGEGLPGVQRVDRRDGQASARPCAVGGRRRARQVRHAARH